MAQVPVLITKCSTCSTNDGSSFCYECNQALCEACKTIHDKFKSTKNHKVTDIKKVDRLVFKTEIECTNHKEIYTIFCTKCRCLVCTSCLTSDHKGHEFAAVDEVVEEARKEVSKLLNERKEKIAVAFRAIEDIKTTQTRQKRNELEITKVAAVFTNIVETVTQSYLPKETKSSVVANDRIKLALQQLENQKESCEGVCSRMEHLLAEPHNITFYLFYDKHKKDFHQIEDISECRDLNYSAEVDVDSFTEDIFSKMGTAFGRTIKKEKAENTSTKDLENNKLKLEEEANKREQAEKEINSLKTKLCMLEGEIRLLKGKQGHGDCNSKEENKASLEEENNREMSNRLEKLQSKLEIEENRNESNKKLAVQLREELEKKEQQFKSLEFKLEKESKRAEEFEDNCREIKGKLEDAVSKAENSERIVCELRRRCESTDEKFQEEHRKTQELEAELKSFEYALQKMDGGEILENMNLTLTEKYVHERYKKVDQFRTQDKNENVPQVIPNIYDNFSLHTLTPGNHLNINPTSMNLPKFEVDNLDRSIVEDIKPEIRPNKCKH
ncbi:unnamed protein product [Mytilus coruscus]|uniref:B box-type domain-containing protein n=1 Tax=Mytilus coruscus TaxID=42192 RepID=A0A6J8CTT8_MYTCO|nr:unnamed protein product [Mytilus coruscus]